jgi:hypothetical protein
MTKEDVMLYYKTVIHTANIRKTVTLNFLAQSFDVHTGGCSHN